MGSYDVGCAVSGLAIGWQDEAYVIPLMPENCQLTSLKDRRFYVHTRQGSANLYSNGHYTYSDDLYQPLLPILGTYSDYGYLNSIEENDYTRLLEGWFGISIDDIVRIITTSNQYGDRRRKLFDKAETLKGKDKQRFDILTKLSSMFVHKDIYQHLAGYKMDETRGWMRFPSLSDAYDKLHLALVDHDNPPDVEGESEADRRSRICKLAFRDPIEGNPPRGEKAGKGYHLAHFLSHRWHSFRVMFRGLIKQGQLKEEICDFLQFDSGLSMCNRMYFPTVSSGQESKNEANINLYRAALKVIGKNIARIAEENIVEDKKCRFCKQMKTRYVEDSCKECHLQYCGW